MNKALLIWNVVLTVLLVGMVIIGCGPQYDYLAQIQSNRQAIEQLAALANANRDAINTNSQAILTDKLAIETYASSTQAAIAALQASLTQYIEQYVQAYVSQALQSK